jgi:hypothetical protein
LSENGDPIDAAVEAVERPAQAMEQTTVTISSTGRPVVIAWPPDMTDGELLEFVGWLSTNLRLELAKRRAKGSSRLIVPAHVVRN